MSIFKYIKYIKKIVYTLTDLKILNQIFMTNREKTCGPFDFLITEPRQTPAICDLFMF